VQAQREIAAFAYDHMLRRLYPTMQYANGSFYFWVPSARGRWIAEVTCIVLQGDCAVHFCQDEKVRIL
jgi:hypothetical protein